MQSTLSRRSALRLFVTLPVLSGVVAACGGASKPESCSDVSSLSAADKTAREALKYTDASPQPDKRCSGCTLYKAAPDAASCGGCQVVKGPIHPDGYCVSWAKKA